MRRVAVLVPLIHIEARSLERLDGSPLVRILNRVVGRQHVGVDVALVLVGPGGRVRVVALDRDLAERRVVVPVLLDVLRVPVDLAARPLDGALFVGGEAAGPEGELDARGGLGVVPLREGLVPGLALLLGAADLAVDGPGDLLGGPADLVLVPLAVGVVDGDVTALVVCGLLD